MNNKDFKQMNEKFFDFLNKTTDPKGADKYKVDPGAVKSHGMLGKAANLLKRKEFGSINPSAEKEQPEDSDRIWGLNGENNPESLESLLKQTDCIDDKQKAAFLNHMKELADDENIALEEAVTLGGSKSEKDRIFSPETVQELMDFIGEFDLDAKCNKQLLKILNVWGANNTVKFSAPSGNSKEKEKEKEPEEEKLNCKMSLESFGRLLDKTVAKDYKMKLIIALKKDIPSLRVRIQEARDAAPDLVATLEVLKDIVEKNKEAAQVALEGILELLKSCGLQLSQGTVAGLRKIGLISSKASEDEESEEVSGKRDDIEKGDSFVYTSKKGNKSAIQVVDPKNKHGATISQKIDPKTCDPKKNSEFATNAEKFAASAKDPNMAPVGEPIEKCSLDDEKSAAETASPEDKENKMSARCNELFKAAENDPQLKKLMDAADDDESIRGHLRILTRDINFTFDAIGLSLMGIAVALAMTGYGAAADVFILPVILILEQLAIQAGLVSAALSLSFGDWKGVFWDLFSAIPWAKFFKFGGKTAGKTAAKVGTETGEQTSKAIGKMSKEMTDTVQKATGKAVDQSKVLKGLDKLQKGGTKLAAKASKLQQKAIEEMAQKMIEKGMPPDIAQNAAKQIMEASAKAAEVKFKEKTVEIRSNIESLKPLDGEEAEDYRSRVQSIIKNKRSEFYSDMSACYQEDDSTFQTAVKSLLDKFDNLVDDLPNMFSKYVAGPLASLFTPDSDEKEGRSTSKTDTSTKKLNRTGSGQLQENRLHESYRRTRDEEVYAKLMEKLLK